MDCLFSLGLKADLVNRLNEYYVTKRHEAEAAAAAAAQATQPAHIMSNPEEQPVEVASKLCPDPPPAPSNVEEPVPTEELHVPVVEASPVNVTDHAGAGAATPSVKMQDELHLVESTPLPQVESGPHDQPTLAQPYTNPEPAQTPVEPDTVQEDNREPRPMEESGQIPTVTAEDVHNPDVPPQDVQVEKPGEITPQVFQVAETEKKSKDVSTPDEPKPDTDVPVNPAEESLIEETPMETLTSEEKTEPASTPAPKPSNLAKIVIPSSGGIKDSTPIVRQPQLTPHNPYSTPDDLEDEATPAGPKTGPVPLMSLSIDRPGEKKKTTDNNSVMANVPIPKALEEALAYKQERAFQLGVNPADIERFESEGIADQAKPVEEVSRSFRPQTVRDPNPVSLVEDVDFDERKDKGKRQKKKKKRKKNRPEEWARQAAEAERKKKAEEELKNEPEVEVEYVQEKVDLDPTDPMYRTFSKIFDAFKIQEDDKTEDDADKKKEEAPEELTKVPKLLEEDDMIEQKDPDDDDKPKLSKRKLKKLNRLSVAELKQLVPRPDVVEMHDVTARDPRLLVHLKSTRNTVPVPRHWCFKRKYLQGKRGIEKPPFDLPDFIKKTGIMEMRAALQEKEDSKTMKTKMREKVRPKLGKIDIDYQKLHDAFFKWQSKPRMTMHGDLYYEGKEFEIRLKEKKPGDLTDELRTALGMPVGPNAHKVPPPWLIAMQRYGPPPSYPNLKIPGLNAAIPESCSFGYHAGGWGKPPVDESGKPLYGDVFGTADAAYNQALPVEEIDTSLWGELESESEEEEEESEEEEEEDEAEEPAESGLQTPVVDAGQATPSGLSSVGAGLGMETPELVDLRKKRIEAEMEGGETPNLYTVIPEKRNDRIGTSMMGSTHTYDISKGTQPSGGGSGRAPGFMDSGGVELALNPEEVELMDTDAMQARAEAALREKQASLAQEDLSDMVAEHAAKQTHKRKRQGAKEDGKSGGKKYKEFKF